MLLVSFLSAASIILFYFYSISKCLYRKRVHRESSSIAAAQDNSNKQCRTTPILSIWVSKRRVLIYVDCHEHLRNVEGQHEPTFFFFVSASCWWWKKNIGIFYACVILRSWLPLVLLLCYNDTTHSLHENQTYFEQLLMQYLLISTKPLSKVRVMNIPPLFSLDIDAL